MALGIDETAFQAVRSAVQQVLTLVRSRDVGTTASSAVIAPTGASCDSHTSYD